MRVRDLWLEKEVDKSELHHCLDQHSVQSSIKTAPDLGIWSLAIGGILSLNWLPLRDTVGAVSYGKDQPAQFPKIHQYVSPELTMPPRLCAQEIILAQT